MKKNLFWSLFAAAGLFAFAACDNGGEDVPEEGEKPIPPPVETITIKGKTALGSYFEKWRVDKENCVFQVNIYTERATGSAYETLTLDVPSEALYLTLCCEVTDDAKPTLAAGTYKVVNGNTTNAGNCLIGDNQSVYVNFASEDKITETKIKSGTIEVGVSGSNYTIDANLILINDKALKASFTGAITAYSIPYSMLREDFNIPLTGFTGESVYIKKPFGIPADFWEIILLKQDKSEVLDLMLMLPADETSLEGGIPAGEYPVIYADDYEAGKYGCAAGQMYITEEFDMKLNMSWYTGKDSAGKGMNVPVGGGKVKVEKEGDIYTLTFDLVDDSLFEHKMTGSWVGKLPARARE